MRNQIEDQPTKVDPKYLCPNEPNKEKIEAANWIVLPADGPVHQAGWITETRDVNKKRRAFVNGKEMEWDDTHKTATWKCQTCGAEKTVDPYP